MPRFYFNIRTREDLIEGSELTSLAASRDEAIGAAREIMSQRIAAGRRGGHDFFEITDAEGKLPLCVAFEEAVHDD